MDGKGRWMDNVFIERLWWSLKDEYVYLNYFRDGRELKAGVKNWIDFYNFDRGHSSLEDCTPNGVNVGIPPTIPRCCLRYINDSGLSGRVPYRTAGDPAPGIFPSVGGSGDGSGSRWVGSRGWGSRLLKG